MSRWATPAANRCVCVVTQLVSKPPPLPPVHAMPIQARRAVEAVALIGPPAVDADIHERLVNRPVARHLTIGWPRLSGGASARQRLARCTDRSPSREPRPFDHDVQHDLEMLGVQFVEHLLRIGKVRRVPGELAVARIPAGRRELGAEIDQRVAGSFFSRNVRATPRISSGPASVRCDCW